MAFNCKREEQVPNANRNTRDKRKHKKHLYIDKWIVITSVYNVVLCL